MAKRRLSGDGMVRFGTLKSYRCYIEYYIKPQLCDKQISLISQQDIQMMYRRLKTEWRIVIGYDNNDYPKTKNVLAKTKKECLEKLKTLKEECDD